LEYYMHGLADESPTFRTFVHAISAAVRQPEPNVEPKKSARPNEVVAAVYLLWTRDLIRNDAELRRLKSGTELEVVIVPDFGKPLSSS
jgi:hypothetical protein